jgi:hypothetical protein
MAKDEDLDLTIARFPFGAGEPQQPSQDQVKDRESTRACYGIDVTVREARVSDPFRSSGASKPTVLSSGLRDLGSHDAATVRDARG